jgi:hypothetical protein
VLCLLDGVVAFAVLFQVLNKPYMLKVRVVRSETAMTDVLREVSNLLIVFVCIIIVTSLFSYGMCKVLWGHSSVSFEKINTIFCP